jgi:hypothetical protein
VLARWTIDGHDMTCGGRAGGRRGPCRVDCER